MGPNAITDKREAGGDLRDREEKAEAEAGVILSDKPRNSGSHRKPKEVRFRFSPRAFGGTLLTL